MKLDLYCLLVVLQLLLHQVSCFYGCARVTKEDLGNTTQLSNEGILAFALANDHFNIAAVDVVVIDINVVCEAQHKIENRYRYTSVVVSYICASNDLRLPNCNGTVVITNQLTLACELGNWSRLIFGDAAFALTPDPTASLSTVLNLGCDICISPHHPVAIQGFLAALPDNVTHCVDCLLCSTGLQRCYQYGHLNEQTCCSYFHQGVCVVECPAPLVPNSDFECGCMTTVDLAVMSPKIKVVELGTNFTLICNVNCTSNTTQVVWFGETGLLDETSRTFDQDSSTLTSLLTLANISYNDGGLYSCSVSAVTNSTVVVIVPTVSPPEISSTVGDNAFSFTCNVQSSLSSTITWYKYDSEGKVQQISFTKLDFTIDYGSGNDIVTPFNNVLNFENVTFEDAGVYQCSVTDNELGEIRSANAIFTVSPESSVTITPNTSNNFQGDTQMFSCSAMGGPGNMFSWRRLYDNTIVGNTSNLTVSVGGAADGGHYRCEVSNLAGNGSDTATLNVGVSIVISPLSVNVTVNETVSLTCMASGFPLPSIRWSHNRSELEPLLSTVINILGERSVISTLIINMATPDDSGEYACDAFDSFSSATSITARVMVTGICTMTVAVINSQVVEPGTDLTLICNVTCASNTTQVVWFSETGELGETSCTFDQDTSTHISLLTLANINYNDGGQYICFVPSSGVFNSAVVVIAPTISPPEISGTVRDNALSFTCNVQSSLSSTITWYKYDLEDELQEISFTTDDGSGSAIAISFNNVLNFENVTFEDAGVYQCSVTDNELGEIRSANATFTVSPKSSVTITPNTSNNFQGDTQTFSCSAMGGPRNMFSWTRLYDNTIVGNTSNLTVSVSGATDGGQYRCEVSNLAGNSSDTATLNVGPVIFTAPFSVNVSVSDALSLNCVATGFPTPTITWFLNENKYQENRTEVTFTILERSVNSTLTIDMAMLNDSGEYLCNASSPNYDTVSSDPATVMVMIVPPSIVMIAVSPSSIAIRKDNVTFTCDTHGGPGNMFQWQRNGVNLDDETQSTLQLTSVEDSDGGGYTCVVSNAAGSDSAVLTLYIQPYIVTDPQPQILAANDDQVSFTCEAMGFPYPSFRWMKDKDLKFESLGQNLTFSPVIFGDEGTYRCVAHISLSMQNFTAVSQPGFLIVSPENSVTVIPNTTNNFQGDTQTFTCSAMGGPGNMFSWKRLYDNTIVGNTSNLTVNVGGATDGGQYRCEVSNLAGTSTDTATLNVGPILYTINPPSVNVSISDSHTLTCEASGFPVPTIIWVHNGTEYLPLEDRIIVSYTNGERSVNSTLTINMAMLNDSGEYVCNASTPGYDTVVSTNHITLLVQATPEKPQNVTAVELTTTNVYLTWVEPHDSNAPIHGYRVSYIIPSFLGGTDITVNSTIEAVNITGLHPGAGYIFSVVAFNDIGDSARGSVMVTTVETVPTSAPENIVVTAISPIEIQVNWTEVPKINQNGNITTYEVMYEPLITFDILTVAWVDTTNVFIVLTGLEENVEYNISVRAYTSVGPGPFSLEEMEITFEDAPASSPQNVTANVFSSTEIQINWTEVPEINQNGVITEYEIMYEPLVTFSGVLNTTTIRTTRNLFITLNDLEEYVEYNISVRAYTSVGPGPYSVEIVGRTLEGAPSNSPTIDSIMLLSPTEIQVNWTAVPEIDRNGVISMYEVLYMSAFSINGSVFTMDGDTFTAHITGLEEFVVYNVSVRAYTSAGPGPFSEVETAGGAGICTMTVAVISSQVVEPETDLTLFCNVTCASNTTQVVWFGETGPLGETSRTFDQDSSILTSLLTLANISYNDGGLYSCSRSAVTKSTVVVIVPTISPPEISSTVGDNALGFTCNVQSSLSSTINWYKYDLEDGLQEISFSTNDGSGNPIATPFNNVLNFENVTFEDAGVYQCSVTDNELGEIRSANATFTVSPESSVTITPNTSNNFQGDTQMFSCSAMGGPGNMFSWTKLYDNTIVGNTSNITVSVNGATDGGQYRCEVSNLAGNDSDTATLNIGPIIFTAPMSVNVSVSDVLSLNCVAIGIPTPTITWFLNGNEYQEDENRTTVTLTILERLVNSTLTINMAILNDSGEYVCNASSPNYDTVSSDPATVMVMIVPPSIVMIAVSPSSIAIRNDNVTFICDTHGGPGNMIQWQRNGANLDEETQSTLQLTSVDASDGGEYTCVVNNSAGSDSAVLTLYIQPYILTDPQPQILAANDDRASFTCEAMGFPYPSYRWIKDEDLEFESLRQNLTFSPVIFGDEGTYRCTAHISLSMQNFTALSQPGFLIVSPENSVTVIPNFTNNFQGDTQIFTCSAMGGPGNMFSWRRLYDNTIVGNTSNLIVNVGGATDGGQYRCEVSNLAGNDSSTATLNVGPVIFTAPLSLNVSVSDALSLNCVATGFPPPTITWFLNGNEYQEDENRTMVTFTILERLVNSTLTINMATLNDSGEYVCNASSPNYETVSSDPATVMVMIVPPSIVMIAVSPSSIAIRKDNVTFTCDTHGGPGNVFLWQRNGVNLDDETQSTLKLTSVDASDGGEYTCIVSNAAGSDSAVLTLYIQPYIVTDPQPQILAANNTQRSFTCEAMGFPDPSYRWMKDEDLEFESFGQNLAFSPVIFGDEGTYRCISLSVQNFTALSQPGFLIVSPENSVTVIPNFTNNVQGDTQTFTCSAMGGPGNMFSWRRLYDNTIVGNTSNLTVSVGGAADGGQYRCEVSNLAGTSTDTATLNVGPIIYTINPSSVNVSISDSHTLTCEASGFPVPTIIWIHNGTEYLPLEDRIFVSYTNGEKSVNSTLTINMAMLNDSGEYFCNASTLGYDTVSANHITLLVQATPEKPQNVTAVELTTTSVYLTWVEPHDSNTPIHGYRVSYIIPSFLGGTDMTVNSTIEAVNITGLHPGAGYIFSVVAFNDIGDSAPGSVMVTTVETVPTSAPENIVVTAISPIEIQVNWTEVPEINRNGNITTYEVMYEPLITFDILTVSWVDTTNVFIVLTGLEENVEYNISVRAYTSVGPGPFSSKEMEITFEDAPASSPQNVTANVFSSTEIQVNWTEVPEINQNGMITEYEIMYEPLVTFSGVLNTTTIITRNLFITLNDLEEYVEYNISVRAYTSVGPGPYSVEIVGRTLEGAPSNSPTIDSIMLLSPTEIQVNWTAVPEIDRNGVISMYEVLYMSAFSINGSVFTMDGDTFTAHITGLEEFVVYNVSVRAYTSIGPGPFSEVETAGGAVSPENSVAIAPNTSNNFQGDTQTFACSAMGGPGNIFSWTRLYDNTIVGNTSNLTVNVGGATDGGQYRCEVSNLAGNGFDTATLNVGSVIVTSPSSVNMSLNEPVNLTCVASGFPVPTVYWSHNGIDTSRSSIITNIPGERSVTSILTIRTATSIDSGEYICNASSVFFPPVSSTPAILLITDECSLPGNLCQQLCYNTDGSYTCDCFRGFLLATGGHNCTDINECENLDVCVRDQVCVNTNGSFRCDCLEGFVLMNDRFCQDVDECRLQTNDCEQLCVNTQGSYVCDCDSGYTLSDSRNCEDINECHMDTSNCDQLCYNTIGSFTCDCRDGYILAADMFTCEDIDECQSRELNRCEQNCINSNGSFHCDCVIGFILSPNRFDCSAVCPDEFDSGLWWPVTVESTAFSQSCNEAGLHFRAATTVTRYCQLSGVWSEVDLTTCTVLGLEPFLIVYFSLIEPDDPLSRFTNSQLFMLEIMKVLENTRVSYSEVSVANLFPTSTGVTISFEIILNSATPLIFEDLNLLQSGLGPYQLDPNAPYRILGVSPSETCQCGSLVDPLDISSGYSGDFLQLCFRLSLSPCNCSITRECLCRSPYVGDGNLCTLDSDGDSYPDVALNSSTCPIGSSLSYCNKDVCPMIHDETQDPSVCRLEEPGFDGCQFGLDLTWSIEWPNTPSGSNSTQQCPGGLESVTGQATRLCSSEGEWEDPNVLSCQQMEFIEIEAQTADLLSGTLDPASVVESTVVITQQLAVITEADTTPLLPSSLNTTNQVLSAVINALEQVGNDTVTTVTNELVLDVFSNILERNNSETWMSLQEDQNTGGSQVLLSNVERFSVLVARSQSGNDSTEPVRISRPNIAVSAKLYDGSQMDELKNDLTFPQEEDLANYSSSVFIPAQISIPPGFLQERLSQQNGSSLPVTFILLQNLEAFLPSSARALGDNTGSASVVISSQVGDRSFTGASVSLKESPILLNFTFKSVQVNESTVQYHCVFWNFSNPVGSGGWITDGVNTVGNASDGASRSTVNCASSHLTSFAVLFTAVRTNETRGDEFALEVVSYIGCAISIISLLIAVVFYLAQGKTLFTSVHNFVHLNLCISLLLSYSVFVAGVSTAVGNTVGCAFVAALLHYLFLSTFCWMLCEGVMLYLMLVVVFSRLAKTWWFFLLLGYVTPIPIVAITVGIRWQYYESLDVCWLPLAEGTIFGFIVPVLVIMMINFVFIVIALRVIVKNQKGKALRTSRKGSKQKSIARSILLATVVLLPLLGLTWLFGLLLIVDTSPVFNWLFTILNSLQGLAILFFHVIRSDKVWSKIGPRLSSASKWLSGNASRRFRLMTGSSTFSAYRNKSKSISDDTGLSTLRSTLARGSTIKQPPSSSLSFTNPQSKFHSDTGKEDLALSMVPMETMNFKDELIKSPTQTIRFKFKGATVVVYPNTDAESKFTAEL